MFSIYALWRYPRLHTRKNTDIHLKSILKGLSRAIQQYVNIIIIMSCCINIRHEFKLSQSGSLSNMMWWFFWCPVCGWQVGRWSSCNRDRTFPMYPLSVKSSRFSHNFLSRSITALGTLGSGGIFLTAIRRELSQRWAHYKPPTCLSVNNLDIFMPQSYFIHYFLRLQSTSRHTNECIQCHSEYASYKSWLSIKTKRPVIRLICFSNYNF